MRIPRSERLGDYGMCPWCGRIVGHHVYHDCEQSKAAAKARMDAIMEKWGGTFASHALRETSEFGSWDANGSPVE